MSANHIRACNLVLCGPVEKHFMFLVPKVSKAVPLGAALGIEGEHVVIDCAGGLVDDVLDKRLAIEAWFQHPFEEPVGADTRTVLNLFCCSRSVGWCEEVQHAALVVFTKQPPSIAWGPVFAERERIKGRSLSHNAMRNSIDDGVEMQWKGIAKALVVALRLTYRTSDD